MLSYIKGKSLPIAKIIGGPSDGRKIYLHEEIDDDLKEDIQKQDLALKLYDDLKTSKAKISLEDITKSLKEYSVSSNSDYFKSIKLPKGSTFQVLPDEERDVQYIAAASGAGKSYYISKFVEQYLLKYPQNEIFLVSSKKRGEDPAYNKFLDLRLPDENGEISDQSPFQFAYIDFAQLTRAINHNHFPNSLFIFDDTETISGLDDDNDINDLDDIEYNKRMKAIKSKSRDTKDLIHLSKEKLLKNGRAKKISVIITSHIIQAGNQTKDIILESKKVVLFPKYGTKTHTQRYLKAYEGLEPTVIKNIINTTERWVLINRHGIKYYLSPSSINIIE